MAESQQKPVVAQPPPYVPTKFFVSSLNTFLGQHLVARLRNDHLHPDNPNRIIGTVVKEDQKNAYGVPEGVRKVIDVTISLNQTEKVKFFEDVLLNSDVIIYDLNTCNLKQAEFVISTLKINPFQGNKVLICVSNVMTWAKTKPKQKKEGDEEEGADNPPEEPDTEEEGAPQPPQGEQKKTYVRFTDKDYSLRKPAPEYQKIKSIETLCLAAGNVKPSLKTYVVCSGVYYGAGEILLREYFLQARLQIPQKLPYYGNGKNRIPMVHIQDLVTYVEKIVQKKPNIPYLLALDHNPKPTQKKIIEAISKGIGTAKVQSHPKQNSSGMLMVDLRMRPSMVFAQIQEKEAALGEGEEGADIVKFKFGWKCKQGIQKNIQNLRKEYNQVHGLFQQKIFLMGPPGSGKTFYAQRLAKKYYLPRLDIKGIITQAKALQNELGEEVRTVWGQKEEEAKTTKQTQYDQLKEKMSKIPKQLRQPLPPFDPNAVDVRLPEELIHKLFKWRLTQNDCLNRGYLLDGYPRRYLDAKELFMGIPVVEGEEGGDGGEGDPKKVIEQRLVPGKLIVLEMSDADIMARLQSLPEETISQTHLTENKIKQLLKRYRTLHDSSTGEHILEDFFVEAHIQVDHVNISSQTESVLESLVRPISVNEENEREKVVARLREQKAIKEAQKGQKDKKQKIVREVQNQDYNMKKQNEQNEEREALDRQSLALRKYLDVNLVPILAEGIKQILSTFPNDPVDALAEFLFKNSLKVPNPDPTTFQI